MMAPLRYTTRAWLTGWAVIDVVTDRIIAQYETASQANQACQVFNGIAR